MRSPTRVTLTPVPCSCRLSLGLVLVHHRADRATGQRADAGADQRIATVVAAGEKADPGAGQRTQRRTAHRVRNLLLARMGSVVHAPSAIVAASTTSTVFFMWSSLSLNFRVS